MYNMMSQIRKIINKYNDNSFNSKCNTMTAINIRFLSFFCESSNDKRQTLLHVGLCFRAILDLKVCQVLRADLEEMGPQESMLIQALEAYLENR